MKGIKKVFVTPLTEVSATDKEGVGSVRFEGNKIYKWVKLLNTTATVAGVANDPVAYGAETGAENNLVVVDLSDADAKPICAGQVLAAVTGTAGTSYYVWIQIKGPADTTTAIAGTPADGDKVYLSATDKTYTVGAAADDPVCVYVNDATAKIVILDCPF